VSAQSTSPEVRTQFIGGSPRTRDASLAPDDLLLFAQSLAFATTSEQVAAIVATSGARCVGAAATSLARFDPADRSLHVHDSDHPTGRATPLRLDDPHPLAAAARTGRTILLSDLDACRRQFPAAFTGTEVQASASLPLTRAIDGSLIGAISFAWREPTELHHARRLDLLALAALCAGTLERTRRYDTEHELILRIQNQLLGELPAQAGLRMAARYLPAGRALLVGGDWYEGLLLDDGRVAVVVGDVAGHGVAAAADMALIRGMITAFLHAGIPIAEVFGAVTGVLCQRTTASLATVALAIVDVAKDSITFATAGHPPPVLRFADGTVRRLDTANTTLIGVAGRPTIAGTAPFPVGAQLVMYTDGLVERRDREFDIGIDRLVDYLANRSDHLEPADMIDAILGELVGDLTQAEDDIAILTLEHIA
jgi:hypothetical protein